MDAKNRPGMVIPAAAGTRTTLEKIGYHQLQVFIDGYQNRCNPGFFKTLRFLLSL